MGDQNLYDAFPYFSKPFAEAHIDRLAAYAHLFGIDVPPLETARVLELGSASGGHLMPQAEQFPDATFVGIDLSLAEIEEGRERIAEAGLTNLRLHHMSISDMPDDFGSFDYIVAHGLFSWIPPAVRLDLGRLCKKHLAPTGVAYISFNTLPGWCIRGMLRDMMLFHTRKIEDPREKVAQARAMLEFVAAGSDREPLYQKLVQNEVKLLAKQPDYYIFHDHLSPENHPMYFESFCEEMAGHGLGYLADVDFGTMFPTRFPEDIARTLLGVKDIVRQEQYMDLLSQRTFRRVLVCHEEREIRRVLEPESILPYFLRTSAVPDFEREEKPEPPLDTDEPLTFSTATGDDLSTNRPYTKAGLLCMRDQLQGLTFDEIVASAEARLGRPPVGDDVQNLRANLFTCLVHNVVHLSRHRWQFVGHISERPMASPVTRLQARRNDPYVSNRRHEATKLNHEFQRRLLVLLDGTRTHAELATELINLTVAGDLTCRVDDELVTDPVRLLPLYRDGVAESLEKFMNWALLIG